VRMGAAIVMGAAIAGMHYTGMAAANFPLGSVCLAAGTGMGQNNLAVLVTVATVAVLAIALLAAAYDARLAARAHILAASQAIAEERRALYLQEQAARLEAERVSALKDEFLATLSHELRTPLNAVMGWSQLLMQGRCDASTRQRGLETIERNARAQARLIEDLLDMSKIISGKMQLEKGPVWPGEFVALAVDSVRPAALARKIRIDTQLDERLDPRVDPSAGPLQGDAGRLQQVMLNLLSNAVKFTPPGGQVRVSLLREAGAVAIQVADTGIGIAPEFLPFVFDRFRQADASTTRRHGGLGLGLSIASQLAQMQGGSLVADSAGHGHGAAFTLRLPLPLATVVA
jgi:signal transduction histidine kinase